jgi:hypothetical protein
LTFSRILIAAVILSFLTVVGGKVQAGGLSWKAGLGYDYFSQQYFYDSTRYVGADSVLTRFALTSNFLNDVRGLVDLTYTSPNSRTLEIRAGYEQTPHLLRTKFQSDWRPKVGASRLDWHSEVDWRDRYDGPSTSGDTYLLGSTNVRFKIPAGASTTLWAQAQGDGVYFYDNTAYSYNYYRGGGKIGFDRLVGNLNILQVDLFALGREVPDSISLSYFSGGIESSLFGSFGRIDVDLMTRLERKEYGRADNEGNYTRFELDGRNRVRLGRSLFSRWDLTADLTHYSPGDPLNSSYERLTMALLGGYEFSGWSLAVGPEGEYLHQRLSDLLEREDYVEAGGETSVDLVRPGTIVGSLQSVTGRRNIQYQTTYLTSYSFERISLFSDWTLRNRLDLNLLASAEWEWHSNPSNNNRIYLISSSLTFRF